jgi:hypothetical protein
VGALSNQSSNNHSYGNGNNIPNYTTSSVNHASMNDGGNGNKIREVNNNNKNNNNNNSSMVSNKTSNPSNEGLKVEAEGTKRHVIQVTFKSHLERMLASALITKDPFDLSQPATANSHPIRTFKNCYSRSVNSNLNSLTLYLISLYYCISNHFRLLTAVKMDIVRSRIVGGELTTSVTNHVNTMSSNKQPNSKMIASSNSDTTSLSSYSSPAYVDSIERGQQNGPMNSSIVSSNTLENFEKEMKPSGESMKEDIDNIDNSIN